MRVLCVVLLAMDRAAVAIGFAVQFAPLGGSHLAIGFCRLFVRLELGLALVQARGFALVELAGLDALADALFLVGLALVKGRRCRRGGCLAALMKYRAVLARSTMK